MRVHYCGPRWNTDQWDSYNALTILAKQKGDPHNVKPVAEAMGAILKRCWPEVF